MPIIEGIGDEVLIFVTVLFLIFGVLLAWLASAASISPSAASSRPLRESRTTPTHSQEVTNVPPTQPPFEPGSNENNECSEASKEATCNKENESESERPSPPVEHSTDGIRHRVNVDNSKDGQHSNVADSSDGLRVKLKYLDDRETIVSADPTQKVSDFKRYHFHSEISENKIIRLIYNGQEMRSDCTLGTYNLIDMSVIHCLISQSRAPEPQQDDGVEVEAGDIDLSGMMFPLFGLILVLIWYCRIMYRTFFNAMSTLALIGVSILFLFAVVISYRNAGRRPANNIPSL